MQVAAYSNLLLSACWKGDNQAELGAARKAGMKLLLWVGSKEDMARFEREGIQFAARNRDVVLGVISICPPYYRVSPTELAPFVAKVKSGLRGIQFWVCLADTGPNALRYALPDALDVLAIDCLDCPRTSEAKSRFETVYPKWFAKANGRPLVLWWDNWKRDRQGLVPVCEPGLFRTIGRLADTQGFAGLMFSTYGSNTLENVTTQGIRTRPELVAEIREIARDWGMERNPSPQPPPALAPFDAQVARLHQEAWAKYLGVETELTNSVGMKLVLIPPGEFLMGHPDTPTCDELQSVYGERLDVYARERPQHRVRITKPYWIGKCEVTQAEWEAVMGYNPSSVKGADRPVDGVNWDDTQAFLAKLNEKVPGGGFRLPTEAEFEYACRAGTTTEYCFGDDAAQLREYAWFLQGAPVRGAGIGPVGRKRPNAWGLHDMHGNALEWCQDWYGPFRATDQTDPTGPLDGSSHVLKGGWRTGPGVCRSAYRIGLVRGAWNDVGLRVARSVTAP
jgi:formylglycine-generating enzyme required for sulfatase activity